LSYTREGMDLTAEAARSAIRTVACLEPVRPWSRWNRGDPASAAVCYSTSSCGSRRRG